ncbi:DUF4304 domain-containing protein [Phenylobacterium sp.]|uniref:DUF4304 domain-containing protein n=1 Tax=Phenylobacterium sp. TaxID=1871053 RepID=UPI0035693BA2
MSRRSYVSVLDDVLTPLGFRRTGKRWSRVVGDMLEEIDLQVSSVAGTTANLWTSDLATQELLREAIPWKRPLGIIQEGQRIGELMCGRDIWWKNEPNGPAELAEALRVYAPRYFEGRRRLEDQAKFLGRGTQKWSWTPGRIYLALTLYRMGEVDEARRALSNPPKSEVGTWKEQADSVRSWLGCGSGGETRQES